MVTARGAALVLLVCVVGAAAVVACQVVAGIDRVAKVAPDAAAATDDGGVPANDPCAHVLAPDPPETDDAKDLEIPSFYLALRTVSLTPQAADQSYIGLDLDSVCTCDRRAGTAHSGQTSCTPKQEVCDGDGGADNRAASLFQQFTLTGAPSVNDSIVGNIAAGNSTLLVWISGWNGEPNDREIKVGVLVSTGITDASGCGVTTSDDATHFHPGWCGQDRWNFAPSTTITVRGMVAPLGNGIGYVTNNQLVYKSESAVEISLGRAAVAFNSPTTLGTLTADGSGYKLSGMLAGRIEIGQLLGAIGQLKIGSGTSAVDLCNDAKDFTGVKSVLCNAVDIARTSVFDFQNAGCDAISSAMQFTAEPAVIGSEVAGGPNDSPCSPDLEGNKSKYVCP